MAHGTNPPFFHIIHIIHIIIIFLFQPTSANLIVYFPLKPMGICFLHYWPALPGFKSFVLYTSFVISAHLDDHKAKQMCTKQPVKENLLHYQLSKPS